VQFHEFEVGGIEQKKNTVSPSHFGSFAVK